MIDYSAGFVIGLLAAVLTCTVFCLRSGYGDPPWVISAGVGCGYITGIAVAFLVLSALLAEAFRYHH